MGFWTSVARRQGKDIVMVEDCRYLGVNIDNKLNWRTNSMAVHMKGISRLFVPRELRSRL